MDQIDSETILPNLSLAVMAAMSLLAATMLMPRRWRLFFSLSSMSFILTAARLTGLNEYAGLAKLVSGFALVLVCVSAALHPGKPRAMPLLATAFPVLGLLSIFLVSGAADSSFAMAKQFQWFVMIVAATMTCRCITGEDSLKQVIKALLSGLTLGSVLAMSALLLDPGNSFRSGLGRFTPYGCNPNQIAAAFAVVTILALYFVTRGRGLPQKAFWALLVTIGGVGALLSVSRMALGATLLGSSPSLLRLARRPVIATILAGVIVVAGSRMLSLGEEFDLTHIDNAQGDSRLGWTEEVVKEVHKRPYFGLLYGGSAYSTEAGLNAHNAYVEMAYLCGLTHAVPNAILALFAVFCSVRCALTASQSRFDPMLIQVVCAIQIATFVNGMVNNMIYYPMYTWAFIHVFASQFVICETLARRYARKSHQISPVMPSRRRVRALAATT